MDSPNTRTHTRERTPGLQEFNLGEEMFANYERIRERAESGRVVIQKEDVVWQQNRQGKGGYFIYPGIDDTALSDWKVFINDVETHSGRHVHQGGLVIYVLQGRGHTLVNGERVDWAPGDLMVLPILPGGCEHQHFNDSPEDGTSKWLALIYVPFQMATGAQLVQKAIHPNWKK